MNVVEALQHPDAALVRLLRKPTIYCNVLLKLRRRQFLRLGIFWQLQQRSERMAIPQIQRVDPFLCKLIEVLRPRSLVVEPRKLLRRIAIVVLSPLVGNLRFLQADRRAAQLQLRMVSIIERRRQRMRSTNAIRKFHRAIQNTRWIVSRNDDRIAQPPQKKCFLRIRLKVRNPLVIRLQQWIEPGCEQYLLIAGKPSHGLLQTLLRKDLPRAGVGRKLDTRSRERVHQCNRKKEHYAKNLHWHQPGSFAGTCGSSADFDLPFASDVFWNRTARYGLPVNVSRDLPVNEPGTCIAVIANGSISVAEKFAVVGRGKS
jgi:hypothetical protein